MAVSGVWTRDAVITLYSSTPPLENTSAFLTKVCLSMLERSKHERIHIMTSNPEYNSLALIRNLHSAHIQTLQANSVQLMEPHFMDTQPKTMLFMLDNLNNILNLILSSQHVGKAGVATTPFRSLNETSSPFLNSKQHHSNLPNFCIHHEVDLGLPWMDLTRPCDENLTIADSHLQDHSILPDDLLKHVRGLCINNVWNSKTYLIFYVPNTFRTPHISEEHSTGGVDPSVSLRIVFKFVWRMFKGQKTLICLEETCYRYDPFFEQIHAYRQGDTEQFFDFSWYTMNGKALTISANDDETFDFDNVLFDICSVHFLALLVRAVGVMIQQRGCNFVSFIAENNPDDSRKDISSSDVSIHPEHLEIGLKHAVDIYVIGSGISNLGNLRDLDTSPAMESCQLTFRIPRMGYIPQDVVPFYCFSPTFWIFLVVTLIIFVLIHYALVVASKDIFTEKETWDQNLFPTAMTIYRYTLGISQPRLIMVEFVVGKIVFLVIVFSMMILITLFQSGMFRLLSSQVRYRDMDTLEEIQESNLVLQSSDIEIDAQFLGNEPEFGWIMEKINDGYNFRCARSEFSGHLHSGIRDSLLNETMIDTDEARLFRREVDAMLKSSAFFTRMNTKYTQLRDLVYSDQLTGREYEFHIARERLLSYPAMYFMPRNGFYCDVVNDLLFRMIESGQANSFGEVWGWDLKMYEDKKNDDVVRPFTLTDLRLAFVLLVVGWVLSGFCFILELLLTY
ncbi:unnamed protein product [Bemisia tabaci]|uniref:Ionotropic receptor n=1 Tax=Bemisia tabaci TaxID=7038 RepID=A0A9P0EXV1_BEMTA|nr:unnamed protein product [Bemisia tabaci]